MENMNNKVPVLPCEMTLAQITMEWLGREVWIVMAHRDGCVQDVCPKCQGALVQHDAAGVVSLCAKCQGKGRIDGKEKFKYSIRKMTVGKVVLELYRESDVAGRQSWIVREYLRIPGLPDGFILKPSFMCLETGIGGGNIYSLRHLNVDERHAQDVIDGINRGMDCRPCIWIDYR